MNKEIVVHRNTCPRPQLIGLSDILYSSFIALITVYIYGLAKVLISDSHLLCEGRGCVCFAPRA